MSKGGKVENSPKQKNRGDKRYHGQNQREGKRETAKLYLQGTKRRGGPRDNRGRSGGLFFFGFLKWTNNKKAFRGNATGGGALE